MFSKGEGAWAQSSSAQPFRVSTVLGRAGRPIGRVFNAESVQAGSSWEPNQTALVAQRLPWLRCALLRPRCSAGASCAAVEDFDERQVFRARDNAAYTHEYELCALEG